MRWPARTTIEPLAEASVHVWAASLEVAEERLHGLAATLSSDERRRAAWFHGAVLSRRFIAGRGQLREVLGAYTGCDPSAIKFEYDVHGKPVLGGAAARPPLYFNVSHSGALILYAVSSCTAVGVDVEEIKPLRDMAAVAARYFSSAERERLGYTAPVSYSSAFYCCWTRKEAYLKARGVGLLAPLDGFDVSLTPDERPALLRVAGDLRAPEQWALVHLEPADGFVGAIAVETPQPDVRCAQWAR